jgi:hypothetical protein
VQARSPSLSPLSSWLFLSAAGAALVLSAACSKPAEAPPQPSEEVAPVEEPAPTTEEPAAAPSGKRKNFHDMSPSERGMYMKEVVLPEMKALWASAGEKVDDFSCKTCHGKGVANGSFRMPNEDLPKLDVSDGFADEKKEHPEAVQFMMEKVVPKMASLIDEEPYNPETHQGFGCFGCHTKAEPGSASK